MRLISYVLFFNFLFAAHSVLAGVVPSDSAQNVRLRITNQCDQMLWIQQDFKSKTQDPIVVSIPAGASYDYSIPDAGLAATRFWPKSQCNAHGYDCQVGESTGVPEAEAQGFQHGPYAPDINSKFEASWGCAQSIFSSNPNLCAVNPSDPGHHLGSETWWNGSAVDGYTFPYSISVKNHQNSCVDLTSGQTLNNPGVDCGQLSVAQCPTDANLSSEGRYNVVNGVDLKRVNLQWLDPHSNNPIGCFSPCAKLTTAQGSDNGQTGGGWHNILGGITPESPQAQLYCCPTPPISSEACSAGPAARSSYAQSVHSAQHCDAYTYAYDDAKGLARCNSATRFEVTFCPKASPTNNDGGTTPNNTVVSMTLHIPTGVSAQVNGVAVTNNQVVSILNGTVLSTTGNAASSCTLTVIDPAIVQGFNGTLCAQLVFDNTAKTITFPAATSLPSNNLQLQFNLNTQVGITAYLNDTQLTNATPMSAADIPSDSLLKAYQGSKQASCTLRIQEDTVEKGSGEFCSRLNIVKEGSKVHVYLPADIPSMDNAGTQPVSKPKYVVFGMGPDVYAYFKDQLVTNGSEISLNQLTSDGNIPLTAYENQRSAACVIGKSGNSLSIVPNTGVLCQSGLVLMTQDNGDYYIGLPSPLPEPKGTKAFGLGIAQGMSVTIDQHTIPWNAPDKSIYIKEGVTPVLIQGVNHTQRTCPLSRYGETITWPQDNDCQGVVVNGGVIYFPAF